MGPNELRLARTIIQPEGQLDRVRTKEGSINYDPLHSTLQSSSEFRRAFYLLSIVARRNSPLSSFHWESAFMFDLDDLLREFIASTMAATLSRGKGKQKKTNKVANKR